MPGLRLGGGGDADEAACLLLGEDDAAHVRRLALEARGVDVDDRELRVRVLRRHGRHRVAHQEADGDDEVIALLGRRREIGDVVRGALRDQRPAIDAVLRLRLLQALVGERVEALVVEAADVRDHRDLHRRARGRVGRLARRRIGRRAAARGHEGEHDREDGRSTISAAARGASNLLLPEDAHVFNPLLLGDPFQELLARAQPCSASGSAAVEPFLDRCPQILGERRVALLDLPEIALEQRDQPHRGDGHDRGGAPSRREERDLAEHVALRRGRRSARRHGTRRRFLARRRRTRGRSRPRPRARLPRRPRARPRGPATTARSRSHRAPRRARCCGCGRD